MTRVLFPVTPGSGVDTIWENVEASGQRVPYFLMSEAVLVPVAASLANSQRTITNTVLDFSTIAPVGATHALIRVETADVRFWDDGKNPTATEGMLLDGDGSEAFWVRAVDDFRVIRATGVNATMTILWYKTIATV